jgi:L-cysteine desulfidase
MDKELMQNYIDILKCELIPATGCTEPIAIAFCAAKARDILGRQPDEIITAVSGNIIKNAKSAVIPNTHGLKGINAAVAAGVIVGQPEKGLDVLSKIDTPDIDRIQTFLNTCRFTLSALTGGEKLDIQITEKAGKSSSFVRIVRSHLNIVYIRKDDRIIFEKEIASPERHDGPGKDLLTVKDIIDFANEVSVEDVRDIIKKQISCNMAIAEEGLKNSWGANIGKVLSKSNCDMIKDKAIAYAAAGSDARMSGCDMPVIINSGSGNQGITVSVPVIVYAKELKVSEEKLYRSLIIANLVAIHLKSKIGPLSAFCGAVSAGCAAGCGIAYLFGGGYEEIAHTLVNSLAITSGIVCDGAKPSCAAKIAVAVNTGIFGYEMYKNGQQFYNGDGLVVKGVENTINNISHLGTEGMSVTDDEIIKMMTR